MFQDNQPIVVLGMQRSGTSAVAGALARLGVDMGPSDAFFPSDANNLEGYYELRALTAFSNKCLAFFQLQAGSTRSLPGTWAEYPQARMLVDELKALLVSKFKNATRWGFKQPIASIVWPIYELASLELGLKPQFVICVRNPLEVMLSEANWVYSAGGRQLAPFGTRAVGIWLNYTLSALQAARDSCYSIAFYPHFVTRPGLVLEQIVGQRQSWKPTPAEWAAAVDGVNPNLKHHDFGLDALQSAPELARRLLDACQASTVDRGELDLLCREYGMWQAMLAPQPLSGTKIGIAWTAKGKLESAQVPILPTGDWQLVTFEFQAPPNTLVNGLLFNKSCRIWIRRADLVALNGTSRVKFSPGPGSQIHEVGGILRLDGAYETQQINFVTPKLTGPYRLELEILVEAGPQISQDTAARLADRLHQCAARTTALLRERGARR